MSMSRPLELLDAEGVAVRLALLCLQHDGHPSPSLEAACALRTGLLVDLALAGRLTEEDDGVCVDAVTAGTGSCADALAAELVSTGRTLDATIFGGGVGIAQLADELVDRGLWHPLPARLHVGPVQVGHRRYAPASPALSRAALMPLIAAVTGRPGHGRRDPVWAATAALARAGGLLDGRFQAVDRQLAERLRSGGVASAHRHAGRARGAELGAHRRIGLPAVQPAVRRRLLTLRRHGPAARAAELFDDPARLRTVARAHPQGRGQTVAEQQKRSPDDRHRD